MPRVTVTREDMMLDRLVWEATGNAEAALVEETLTLNGGLAAKLAREGHALPLGMVLMLPEPRAARPPRVATVKLWD